MKKMNSQQHAIMATTTKSHPWLQLQLNCKLKIIGAIIVVLFSINENFAQTTVFSDDFSTNQSTSWTTSGAIGASAWSVTRSGDDWGARRNTSPAQLELTNDVSTTGNATGWVFASTPTASFSAPYNTTLSSNPGVVTWTFNMRQIRTDPAGFSAGSYGVAFVLAGSSTAANNTGNGYAVVLGNTNSTDPVRLVKYTGGLVTLGTTTPPTTNDIIVSNTSGLTDFGAEYLSIKVTYTPSTNTWELFLRNDGTLAFTDPESGTLTSQGTAVDNTYTGSSLGYMGAYWQGSTGANQTAFFDNVKVTVASAGCTAPTSQASNITFSSITSSSMTVNWTNGNGSYRIVKINTSNSFTNPTDGSDPAANPVYGGSGEQVVYNGSGNSVNVTGLSPSTTYWFRVYEYNCTGTNTKYITSTATNNPNSQATSAAAPEINIKGNGVSIADGDATPSLTDHTDFGTTNVAGGTVDRVFTIENLGTANLILSGTPKVTVSGAHASDFTVTVQPSSPIAPSGSTTFTVRFDPSAAGLRTATLTILNNDSDEGTYDFAIQGTGSIVCATDLIISEYYEGASNDKYIEIYNGTAGSINLTGYKISIYFNGGTTPTDIALAGTIAAGATHIIAHSSANATILALANQTSGSLTFNGNDAVALRTTSNTLVDVIGQIGFDPGTEWGSGLTSTADNTLVRKSSITIGDSNGTDPFNPATEWDGYVNTTAYAGSHSMSCICAEPTTHASGMSITGVTFNSANLSWTNGNGSNRIVVAREGAAVSFTPSDNTTYAATTVFSDAVDQGSGNKVVYNGTGSSVTITGLNGGTTYYFKVFEYNCNPGSEDYLTSGTPLTGNTTTLISPVTNLKVECQTNTTAEITWTAPVGNYTGVIIGVRNSTLDAHAISGDASGYTASAVFMSGTQYGSTTPYSYVVYKGTGTSVTVTGLTAGQNYKIKAYTYLNNTGTTWSTTTPTATITSLGTANVTNQTVLVQDGQLQLQWTNPGANCFNEIMIVGNAGPAITTVPTGDGSAYTPNLAFGSGSAYGTGYVVYKGTVSPQTITNLTNGTEYCFTFFTRNGTSWSSGVSICGTPAAITTLLPGDLAIVAVNTQCKPVGSDDEVCFFAFKDITEGTAIDFTDNGYERLYPDLWADSEGTIRLLRKTGSGTVPKGQVICVQGAGSSGSNFDIYVCGVLDNTNWTITSLNGTGSYDLNVDDQIWIMQGGSWDNPAGTHNATYTGNVLYGWTATGWQPAPGYNSTAGSTLYPSTECFNTNVQVTANHSKVKYIGPKTTTSQFNWLIRINDNDNWAGYADNTAYNAVSGYNYVGDCITYLSNSDISPTSGVWTGATNTDWFYCGNWQNLQLPNATSDITIKSGATNDIVIDDGIPSMPVAECNNITLDNSRTLTVNHANSKFNIYGNLSNSTTINQSNGEIHLKGNYNNTGTFNHTGGTFFLDGSSPQTLTGTASFYNLTLNNTSSGVTLSNDITVNNDFTLTQGSINTGNNIVHIGTSTTNRGGTVTQTNGYVDGNVKRWFASATNSGNTGLFPLGATLLVNGGARAVFSAQVEFTGEPTIGGSLTGKFITSLPANIYDGFDLMDETQLINHCADEGIWQIDAGDGLIGGRYSITLKGTNVQTVNTASQIRIIKRPSAGGSWTLEGVHGTASGAGTSASPLIVSRTGLNSFSQFAFGAAYSENPLPIELLYFNGKRKGNIIDLNWSTASETNNDYFTIEKSMDGKEFKTLTSVMGSGNSIVKQYYSAIDNNPYKGLNYYRLIQTDYNGKKRTSGICKVLPEYTDNSLEIVNVQVDDDEILVSLQSGLNENVKIELLDLTGKVVSKNEIQLNENVGLCKIATPSIKAGLYLLKVYHRAGIVAKKIVVP